jgi:hypothetical protein
MFLEGLRFLPNPELLTPVEYEIVAGAAAAFGFRKFRLTGGEPLVPLDITEIVAWITLDQVYHGQLFEDEIEVEEMNRKRPTTMQDSLPDAWPAFPGGIDYPLGPTEKFQVTQFPFPGFAWRTQIISKMTGYLTEGRVGLFASSWRFFTVVYDPLSDHHFSACPYRRCIPRTA